MPAVLDDVRIHEPRRDPLPQQRLRNALSKFSRHIDYVLFFARHVPGDMVAGVRDWPEPRVSNEKPRQIRPGLPTFPFFGPPPFLKALPVLSQWPAWRLRRGAPFSRKWAR